MATTYIAKAEKELKRWGMFAGQSKYENAAEFYKKAGSEYKKNKDWDAAGAMFVKAAETFEKCGDSCDIDARTCWKDAGQCFKKSNLDDAAECYHKAAAYMQASNTFNRAAKLFDELASEYQKENEVEKAIKYYNLAIENFEAADDTNSANRKYLEIANMEAARGNYEVAREYYETNARAARDNQLLRWGAKGHLFKASLCTLCISAQNDTFEDALEKHDFYCGLSDIFDGTREQKLIQNLITACMAGNMNQFVGFVQDYESIGRLPQWELDRLMEVKNRMEGASEDIEDLINDSVLSGTSSKPAQMENEDDVLDDFL